MITDLPQDMEIARKKHLKPEQMELSDVFNIVFSNLQFFFFFFGQYDVKAALSIASFKIGSLGTSLTRKQQLCKLSNETEIGRWFI
jgi:hypothetical protein